jgi:hypothetical protein
MFAASDAEERENSPQRLRKKKPRGNDAPKHNANPPSARNLLGRSEKERTVLQL